jgi:uncharacterized C2H2 Zn-finger protein
MSTKIEEATPLGEALVKHCPLCGVGFNEVVNTNIFFKCLACDKIIQIRTKAEE